MIEVQEEWFSIRQCDSNPHKLYVFGDNMKGLGTGGQACIRYCQNTFGIPTKRSPTRDADAYFSDKEDERQMVETKIFHLKGILDQQGYRVVVFPEAGLGTGLAEMDKRSPELFHTMMRLLYDEYGIYSKFAL